jgi:hypothetical protein
LAHTWIQKPFSITPLLPLRYGSHKMKITAINSNPGHTEIEQYDKNLRFKKINAQDINFD